MISSLSTKAFAKKYAGYRVKLVDKNLYDEAVIIGYEMDGFEEFLLVDPDGHGFNPNRISLPPGSEIYCIGIESYWEVLLEEIVNFIPSTKALSRYPHKCPNCGSPAYVGFTDLDCMSNCRGFVVR